MSVAMAANTEEAYAADLASEAAEEANSREDEIYYRWASSEWKIEGWADDLFAGINTMLRQEGDLRAGSYFFADLIDSMTAALVATKAALGERLAAVTAFVTVTDSDAAEEIENDSSLRINAPGLAEDFRSRFD